MRAAIDPTICSAVVARSVIVIVVMCASEVVVTWLWGVATHCGTEPARAYSMCLVLERTLLADVRVCVCTNNNALCGHVFTHARMHTHTRTHALADVLEALVKPNPRMRDIERAEECAQAAH